MSKNRQHKSKPALTARQRKAIQVRLMNLITDLDHLEQVVTIDLNGIKDRLKDAKDSISDMSDEPMLTLQQDTQALERVTTMICNLMNKIGETASAITANLKAD